MTDCIARTQRSSATGRAAAVVVIVTMITATGTLAQKVAPADLAATLSGSWTLNRELSTVPAPGRGGRRGAPVARLLLTALAVPQRGGRGGGGGAGGAGDAGSPVMAEEVAAQAALRILQDIPLVLTIAATATDVAFTDPRAEWKYKIDGRNTSIDVPGGKIRVKTRWDRAALKQEFSTSQRKLMKTWTVDANSRLVLTERLESMTLNTPESKAVFDRQPAASR